MTRRAAQHISTENLLYHTVSLLSLPICLRMVSSGMQQFGSQPSEQLLPEATHEVGVPVSNNLTCNAILVHHPLNEHVSSLGSSDGLMHRDKRDTLGGSIHHSHGTITPLHQG